MAAFDLPPYESIWMATPPGVFHVYRWLYAFTPGSLLLVHVGMAVCWVATALLVGRACDRLFGGRAFSVGVVAYGLLRSYDQLKAGAGNTEMFLSPLAVLALSLLLLPGSRSRRNAFLGGAALAAAALFKLPIALYGLPVAVALLLLEGPRRGVLLTALAFTGALAVFGLAAAYHALAGDLGAAIGSLTGGASVLVLEGPRSGASATVSKVVSHVAGAVTPWLLALAGLGLACVRPDVFGERRTVRLGAATLALLTAGGLFLVSLGGYLFGHYWVMLHFVMAVGATAGAVGLARVLAGRLGAGRAALAVAVLAAACWVPQNYVQKRWLVKAMWAPGAYAGGPLPRLVEEIETRLPADRPLLVWAYNPELYVFSRRVPATRFLYTGYLTGELHFDVRTGKAPPKPDLLPGTWDAFREDLARTPPGLIVERAEPAPGVPAIRMDAFPWLRAFVRDRYRPVAEVEGFVFYEPRDASTAPEKR